MAHAANVAASSRAELVCIADPDADRAAVAAAHCGAEALGPLDEILDGGEVDAVLVASPTPTHADLIEACLEAGLPVLREKPIDLDISRVDLLRAKVAQSTAPVAIGFNQRFDPAVAEVRTRIVAGEIGQAEHLALVNRDPSPPPPE